MKRADFIGNNAPIDAATLEIAMDIAAELADNKEIEISGDVDEF